MPVLTGPASPSLPGAMPSPDRSTVRGAWSWGEVIERVLPRSLPVWVGWKPRLNVAISPGPSEVGKLGLSIEKLRFL
jgi:hypothetical protein